MFDIDLACRCLTMVCRCQLALPEYSNAEPVCLVLQGILNVDDDVEEEFEIDINEAEPAFLKGQSSRSGVEVCRFL
jgi:hypothetical protein